MVLSKHLYEKLIQHEVGITMRPINNFMFVDFKKDRCEVSICLDLSKPEAHNQKVLSDLFYRYILAYETHGYWKEEK